MIFCELLTRRIYSRLTEMIPIISQSVTFLQMFFFSETVVFLGFVYSFGKNDSVRFFKIFWGKRKGVISVRVPSASVLRLLCAFPSLFSKDLHLFSLVPWCIYRIFLFFNTKKSLSPILILFLGYLSEDAIKNFSRFSHFPSFARRFTHK